MPTLDAILDSYEFGWNVTRSVLVQKQIRVISTIFGNRVAPECGLLRDLEAERLHRKYSLMAMRDEKRDYCDGALDLINEWDRMGQAPKPLLELEDYESGEADED